MSSRGRRTGVAAIAALGLCLGLAGCVSTESMNQPVLHSTHTSHGYRPGGPPSGVHPAGGMMPPPMFPTDMTTPPGTVQQVSARPGQPYGEVMPAGGPANGGSQARPGQPIIVEPVPADHAPEHAVHPGGPALHGPVCPRELDMKSHPPYTVAPPDILLIDAIRLVPKGPYRLEPMEVLQITVADKLPNEPIAGTYMITPEGTINLGYNYGTIRVGGLTIGEAQDAVRKHLSNILKNPNVNLALVQFRGMQQIAGQHLVRSDGTISLGTYGSVYVAGMTLGQVKCQIENYLSAYLVNPQVSVDVLAYNSKKYYVILDGGGFGQRIVPLPITGNETVLDAIANIQGLDPVSSKKRIWVARPSPVHLGCNQILPVDWRAITEGGSTATNYQLFPGDRVYVSANKLIALDNYLSQLLAPVERIFGVTLLGTNTVRTLQGQNTGTTGGGVIFVP